MIETFPIDASIPPGTVSLESILCTEELRRRPWRPPDYGEENRALVALAGALVESPVNILQTLAETILDVTQCDSSGLSLLTKGDGGKRFYWPAIAGEWKRHIGGGTPRDFGPCGDVLDQNRTLLFRHFERRYLFHSDNARGGRMPAGSVLHRGQGSRDNMGDHARRSPQVRCGR